MQQRDCAAYLGRLQRADRLTVLQAQQDIDRPPIVGERRRREPALVLQRMEIFLREACIHVAVTYSRAETPAAHSSPMRRR